MVPVTSTKCVGAVVEDTYASLIPGQAGPASAKTHSLAASRQASSTASPVARWSAWLTGPSSPQVRAKLMVMTTSGRSRRKAAAQRQPVLHQAVHVIEEGDLGDADHLGAAPFLLHPQRRDLVRCHPGDPGLALGGQQVGDLLALAGPPG